MIPRWRARLLDLDEVLWFQSGDTVGAGFLRSDQAHAWLCGVLAVLCIPFDEVHVLYERDEDGGGGLLTATWSARIVRDGDS